MKANIVFWYEFASTYSYLSAMRIEAEARRAEIEVAWRPFLLGPIFKSQGWTTSPFNLYPVKGRYMVRDISRIAASRGLPFQMPATFPANGLKAARLAIAAQEFGAQAAFTRAVYQAAFGRGQDISSDEILSECLTASGLDPETLWALSTDETVKAALKRNTEEAQALGIFGAPSFTTRDGELFWGDDRLEQGLDWASRPSASHANIGTRIV
jgi:2-hydroxychromene-2-carboxylate isomerase